MPAEIEPTDPTRRSWLAGLLALGTARLAVAEDNPGPDAKERAAVEARAREAGLGTFRAGSTAHYLGLGDAPPAFRAKALQICEGLTRDYLEHFKNKGFAVERPAGRMTVVLLADGASYAKFTGEPLEEAVGGQYELESNRLVIFDNRAEGRGNRELAERANLVALAHEATHQLTFNTGLLRRGGDVPGCISEGLAMYAEVRRPSGRSLPGQPNPRRVEELALAWQEGTAWLPLTLLLQSDDALQGEKGADVQHAAYAQSWLLVDTLMKSPALLPKFRAYLKAIAPRVDADHRLDDARAHLGDLDDLNADLHTQANRLVAALKRGR